MHVGLIAHRFLPPIRRLATADEQQGLSVLAREVSMHAWGLRLRRACDALAVSHATVLPSGSPDTVGISGFWYFGAHNFGIPSLHVPLSNASSAALRPPSHGSGSGWFATPFLYDSFIHYFTPVYPDAIRTIRAYAELGISAIMPSAGSCRVLQ